MSCERGEGEVLVGGEAQLIDGSADIVLREAESTDTCGELADDQLIPSCFADRETHITDDDAIDVDGEGLARLLGLGEMIDGVLNVQPSSAWITDEV